MRAEDRRIRFRSNWQARFSYAWIQAVAATAGVTCQLQDEDIDGVDIMLRKGRWPALDVQVKSWTVPVERGGCFKYRLKRRNYDILRESGEGTRGNPIILVLVVMPAEGEKWLSLDDEGMLLRGRACWVSLEGMPPSPLQGDKLLIDVPTANVFSPEALTAMMERIAREGRP